MRLLIGFFFLISPFFVYGQQKQERDSYSAYFQCYKKLISIPLFIDMDESNEDNPNNKRGKSFESNPIPFFDDSKNKVYLFGEKNVVRYDLKDAKEDEGRTIYQNIKLVFDKNHSYTCVNLAFFPGGDNNFAFTCSNQSDPRTKDRAHFKEVPRIDFKDAPTIEMLRKELKSELENKVDLQFKDRKLLRYTHAVVFKMYEKDLASCRDSFQKDTELYGKMASFLNRMNGGGMGPSPGTTIQEMRGLKE